MTATARRLGLACLSVAVLAGAAHAGGQSARPAPKQLDVNRLRAWLDVVARHEAGRADAASDAAAAPPVDETVGVLNDVMALVRGRRDAEARLAKTGKSQDVLYGGRRLTVAELDALLGVTGESPLAALDRLLMRGLLVYSDAAEFGVIFPKTSRAQPVFQENRPPVIIADGQGNAVAPGAYSGAAALWSFARLVADEISAVDGHDRIAETWYQAAAVRLERDRQWGLLTAHLRRALEARPSDPVLLFHCGVAHEFYAGSQAQSARQAVVLPSGSRLDLGPEEDELRQAEACFRQAVERDPAFDEARLRWGHVLGSLGAHEAARRELLRARDALGDPRLSYYAHLFLGRSQMALADRDAARASLEHAATLFPFAQSPLLSLSELARRASDVPGALAALRRLLTLPAARANDPWWTYDVAAARDADALMIEARRRLVEASR